MAGKARRAKRKRPSAKEHPLEVYARRQEEAAKNDPRLIELRGAAAAGDVAKIRRLLKLGLDPGALPPDGGDTAVLAAVRARKPRAIRVLAEAGADLNDGWPDKPLTLAADLGDLELVRALIRGGADVNLPNDSGATPLDEALDKEHLAVIEELLRAGADPDFVSDENRERGNVHSPLERAGYDKRLLEVFQKHGAGAGRDFSTTLLTGAAGRGDLAEVKRLVNEAGADVNAVDGEGGSPLLVAAATGKLSVVKFLVKAGARVDQPCRPHGSVRITALDCAKHARQKRVVEYLLDLQRQGKAGRKPSEREAAAKRPTGVPTFDVNDTCVLLEAPVDKAAAALARHLGATSHEPDVLGEKVKLTGRCFAVFRIVGQPWSILMRLNCADVRQYLEPPDGAALSKALATRAMVVTSGDTSGIYQYVTFDRGRAVEFFDVGSAAGETDRVTIERHIADWYGVDLARLANVDVARGVVFASSLRKPKVARVKHALAFIDDHVKRQNAFVPFWGGTWGVAGERVELTLEGLGPDDVERLDYVAVTAG